MQVYSKLMSDSFGQHKAKFGFGSYLSVFYCRQVSERVVLGQKAYILFYIKNPPTNGHAVPAQPVSPRAATSQPAQPAADAQKRPQTNGLKYMQAASLKSQSAAQANGTTSKVAAAAYGPAERPSTGLTAALQLRDQPLAPVADSAKQHLHPVADQQAAAVALNGATTQTPVQSTGKQRGANATTAAQQPPVNSSQRAAATASDARHFSSLPACDQQPEDVVNSNTLPKLSAKRKSDTLGVSKRPSVLQRMNPASLEAAAGTADMPKRKKRAVDQAVAASTAAVEEPSRGMARGDAPGAATESSQRQSASVDGGSHEELDLPSSRSDHNRNTASAVGQPAR